MSNLGQVFVWVIESDSSPGPDWILYAPFVWVHLINDEPMDVSVDNKTVSYFTFVEATSELI